MQSTRPMTSSPTESPKMGLADDWILKFDEHQRKKEEEEGRKMVDEVEKIVKGIVFMEACGECRGFGCDECGGLGMDEASRKRLGFKGKGKADDGEQSD